MTNRLEPLPEDAREELLHARARAANAERAVARIEAQARQARARAAAARAHYEDLLLEHGGQLTIDDIAKEAR